MDEGSLRAGPSSSNKSSEPPKKKKKCPPKQPKLYERRYDDFPEDNRPAWKRRNWHLKRRHNDSLEASTSDVTKLRKGHWLVESFRTNQKYKLTRAEEECEFGDYCDDYCYYCQSCIHMYTCNCPDFGNGFMCKHIHLLVRFIEDQKEENRDSDDSSNSDDEGRDDSDDRSPKEKVDHEWSKIRQLVVDQEGVDIMIRGLEGIRHELEQHSSQKFSRQPTKNSGGTTRGKKRTK